MQERINDPARRWHSPGNSFELTMQSVFFVNHLGLVGTSGDGSHRLPPYDNRARQRRFPF